MEKTETVIVGSVFVLLAVLGIIHHFSITGRLFDLRDILHHEFFEAVFFTAGIVLLLTALYNRK
ncbi:hypothetical protein MUO71_06535 [Candidatus Bathyarchaeota archaeon]|nr:hypothetical protein [Candidatus Bathyarchaeota archaeon]